VLRARGKLAEAQGAFQEALKISRRLATQDPSNVEWQRELAVACGWIADFEQKAGRHESALSLYDEAARIFGEVAKKAPGFAQWAKEKERAESALAHCRLTVEIGKPSGTTRGRRSSASASTKPPPSSRKS
jgi:tetratricopeptide (TPR) repeat protein